MPTWTINATHGTLHREGFEPVRAEVVDASRSDAELVSTSSLRIGLVNNMPPSAQAATHHQFLSLLRAARPRENIELTSFSNPSSAANDHHSHALDALWDTDLDGLIVTGAEPRAPLLSQEPNWPTLTRLVDWAEDHTLSTIWSCLAAHAAVLHLDQIARRPLEQKCSGIFACTRRRDHALLRDIGGTISVPHSRQNALDRVELEKAGYLVLTESQQAGVDLFVKRFGSLFVFPQGHLEYDGEALLREYRRDVRRFLSGERDSYPDMPENYFDQTMRVRLYEFRARALIERSLSMMIEFPVEDAGEPVEPPWHPDAVQLYRNWIDWLATEKAHRIASIEHAGKTLQPASKRL